MNKKQLFEIFNNIEKEHINLYHDISKEDFISHLNKSAEIIESLDKNQIYAELLKLFRLFKDSHTQIYTIEQKLLPIRFLKIDDKIYIDSIEEKQKDLLLKEVQKINDIDINEVYSRASNLVAIETEEDNIVKTLLNLVDIDFLNILNIGDCSNGVTLTIDNIKHYIEYNSHDNTLQTCMLKCANYGLKAKDGVHIIKFPNCQNNVNYPIEKFCEDIEKQLKNSEQIIVDLRGNQGGSSKYFDSIAKILEQKHCGGYCIIDNGTFSGGTFACASCIWLGFKTIGEKMGQKFAHYGNCGIKYDLLDLGLRYRASTMYFGDNSKRAELDNKIVPEITIKNTIQDLRNDFDRVLQTAINLIKKDKLD